jgi:RNA polymerase sigma-70 factor (ECF subfamily)
VERLPANQQEVIRLKFQSGLSYREISRVTGLTVSHVGVLIHTGLKSIRIKLSPATT